ncbi:hypothetical protein ABU162_22895 [Paenibacillus thiaminolyticus]
MKVERTFDTDEDTRNSIRHPEEEKEICEIHTREAAENVLIRKSPQIAK